MEDISEFLHELDAQGLKLSTIQTYLRPLHGVMKYAAHKKLISVNPCSQLTDDDRPHRADDDDVNPDHHIWSDEEMRALVAAAEWRAKQPVARYDYSPIIRVDLATGLRQSEAHGLRWRDLDLKEGELHVRWQWLRGATEYTFPKTKAGIRTIPMADPAAAHAEIEGVSFHDMRHAYASRLIWEGISSTQLSKLLGHKSAKMTEEIYVHEFNRVQTYDKVKAASSWQ